MYYRDCKGIPIEKGDKVRYRKQTGIVIYDEFEGLYVELENGYKVRVKDVRRDIKVIYKKRKKHHDVGKRM